MKAVNQAADEATTVLRLSWDAKATVKLGDFSRGGKNRLERKAGDHDFKPDGILNPFGILLPRWDDLTLYFTPSPVTSDFIVDMLERWWTEKQKQFPQVDTLVINQDNGPEIQSRRTQFLKRMVEFAWTYGLLIRRTTANTMRSNMYGESLKGTGVETFWTLSRWYSDSQRR